MSTTSTTRDAALTAALTTAWRRAGGDLSAFPAALAALPPRVGSAGWPRRWALAARGALASAAAERAARRAQEYWARRAEEEAAPIWGVEKEYGRGFWSRTYSYEVRIGAGTLTRREAEDAKTAALAGDKVARFHRACWDDFMGG